MRQGAEHLSFRVQIAAPTSDVGADAVDIVDQNSQLEDCRVLTRMLRDCPEHGSGTCRKKVGVPTYGAAGSRLARITVLFGYGVAVWKWR